MSEIVENRNGIVFIAVMLINGVEMKPDKPHGNPPIFLRIPPEIGKPLARDAKKSKTTVQSVLSVQSGLATFQLHFFKGTNMTFVKHVATSNADGIRSSGVGDTYAQAIERCRGQRRGTHLNADVFVFRSEVPFTDLPAFLDRRASVDLSPCGEFAAFTNCEMSRFGQ